MGGTVMDAIKNRNPEDMGEAMERYTGVPFTKEQRRKAKEQEVITISIEESERGGEKNKG